MKKNIFITGATGFLGSFLVKELLEQGHRVIALAKPKNGESAKQRMYNTLRFVYEEKWREEFISSNLKVIEGDITLPHLGLEKATIDLLKNKIDEVFHLAATTELHLPISIARRINVGGTKNLLDMTGSWCINGKTKKINHISSAYIFGDYRGILSENDLDVGQKTRTTYEQTKFEAEKLVEQYRKAGLWIDIFRPSLIIGDSSSGKIFRFKNIYQLLHLCSLEIIDKWPFLDLQISLVPVDLVSKSLLCISSHSKERSKNYHIFPEKLISLRQIISVASHFMAFKMPEIVSLERFSLNVNTPAQKSIIEKTLLLFNSKAKLGSSYTNQVLKKYNFVFPKLDNKMLKRILMFFIEKGMVTNGTYQAN